MDELWTLPKGVFAEAQQALYHKIADKMREALAERGSNLADELIMERIVFAYVHIRDKDAKAGTTATWAHDRVRRETIKDWSAMIENQQRRWAREDMSDSEESTKRKLAEALKAALLDVDPAVAGDLREKLSEELGKAGL